MKNKQLTPDQPLKGRPPSGRESTQKNVNMENGKLRLIEEKKLKYMSFSAYVNSLIDKDLENELNAVKEGDN